MTILTRLQDIGIFFKTAGKNAFQAIKTTIGSSFIGRLSGKVSSKFNSLLDRIVDLLPKSSKVLELEKRLREQKISVKARPTIQISRQSSVSSISSDSVDL